MKKLSIRNDYRDDEYSYDDYNTQMDEYLNNTHEMGGPLHDTVTEDLENGDLRNFLA